MLNVEVLRTAFEIPLTTRLGEACASGNIYFTRISDVDILINWFKQPIVLYTLRGGLVSGPCRGQKYGRNLPCFGADERRALSK
jgi:hypothetical protein